MRRSIKNVWIIFVILILLLCGCGNRYGNEVFKCNPANILGVKSVYEKDGVVTIICDVKEIKKNDTISPFIYKIDNPKLEKYDSITIHYYKNGKEKYYRADSEQDASMEISGNSLKLTINTKKNIAENMYGFGFGSSYINFEEGTIRYTMYGGDCMDNYWQDYDADNDIWSEVNSEFVVSGETYEP